MCCWYCFIYAWKWVALISIQSSNYEKSTFSRILFKSFSNDFVWLFLDYVKYIHNNMIKNWIFFIKSTNCIKQLKFVFRIFFVLKISKMTPRFLFSSEACFPSYSSKNLFFEIPLCPPYLSQIQSGVSINTDGDTYRVGRAIVDCFLRVRCRRCWGLWAERLAKTDRWWSKRWRKCSGGDEQTCCRRGDGLPPNYHSELYAETNKMKIFEGLSNSKNMVFNVKKLLNVGVDLMLRRRSKKKRPWRDEQQVFVELGCR
jgi:hypothetical protein